MLKLDLGMQCQLCGSENWRNFVAKIITAPQAFIMKFWYCCDEVKLVILAIFESFFFRMCFLGLMIFIGILIINGIFSDKDIWSRN